MDDLVRPLQLNNMPYYRLLTTLLLFPRAYLNQRSEQVQCLPATKKSLPLRDAARDWSKWGVGSGQRLPDRSKPHDYSIRPSHLLFAFAFHQVIRDSVYILAYFVASQLVINAPYTFPSYMYHL